MATFDLLVAQRDTILNLAHKHGAHSVRVFGSVARGEDSDTSDLDLLVDPAEGRTSLVTLVRLKRALEGVLGVKTDVLTPLSIHERYRDDVLRDARQL